MTLDYFEFAAEIVLAHADALKHPEHGPRAIDERSPTVVADAAPADRCANSPVACSVIVLDDHREKP